MIMLLISILNSNTPNTLIRIVTGFSGSGSILGFLHFAFLPKAYRSEPIRKQ